MKDVYAKILGNHAADVIRRTSSLNPAGVRVSAPSPHISSCDLAVRIDFKGEVSGGGRMGGHVICGFLKADESLPLLRALAEYFGFDQSLAETKDGPANVLSEFLNIIVGLTGADWAEHGYAMDFSPPRDVSGQPLADGQNCAAAWHVSVATDTAAKVDILAVFEEA